MESNVRTTTGYTRALKFMFIRRELGGMGTGCLFQFTYCDPGGKVLTNLFLYSKSTSDFMYNKIEQNPFVNF